MYQPHTPVYAMIKKMCRVHREFDESGTFLSGYTYRKTETLSNN